jgi:hypothetical protein
MSEQGPSVIVLAGVDGAATVRLLHTGPGP